MVPLSAHTPIHVCSGKGAITPKPGVRVYTESYLQCCPHLHQVLKLQVPCASVDALASAQWAPECHGKDHRLQQPIVDPFAKSPQLSYLGFRQDRSHGTTKTGWDLHGFDDAPSGFTPVCPRSDIILLHTPSTLLHTLYTEYTSPERHWPT